MNRGVVRFLVACAACAAAQAASAQQFVLVPLFWKHLQPWTQPLHAHQSVVQDCSGGLVPFARVAFDDWLCTQTGPIVTFRWWGVSPQPQQSPNRPFYIAIYSDVQCKPGQLLYQTCVHATMQPVGIDCMGRQVFRFTAPASPGGGVPFFVQQAGQRYWLQISEADMGGPPTIVPSPTPGAVDFMWSSHGAIRNCPALQRDATGNQFQPLFDACFPIPEDLAFGVYAFVIKGNVSPPPTPRVLPRPVLIAEWRRPGETEVMHVECFTPDDDGTFYLEPELPRGQYRLTIRGMSLRPSFFDVFLNDENPLVDLGTLPPTYGDANGDGWVDFSDISLVLGGWWPKP